MFDTHAKRACLLLLFCLCSAANARSAASIIEAVAQSLPAADSTWRLLEKRAYPYDDGSIHAYVEWTNGPDQRGATVIVHRTLKSARRAFPPQRKTDPHNSLKSKGIADEAFLWPPIVLVDGAYNLHFRKGRTEVWLSGSSAADIERIASVVAAAIPPKP